MAMPVQGPATGRIRVAKRPVTNWRPRTRPSTPAPDSATSDRPDAEAASEPGVPPGEEEQGARDHQIDLFPNRRRAHCVSWAEIVAPVRRSMRKAEMTRAAVMIAVTVETPRLEPPRRPHRASPQTRRSHRRGPILARPDHEPPDHPAEERAAGMPTHNA